VPQPTTVCTSTGAAGAARRGTDHRRVRCANCGICRSMRNSAAERLDAIPSAEGGMTRLAFALCARKGAYWCTFADWLSKLIS
jgi:hypothetical protein